MSLIFKEDFMMGELTELIKRDVMTLKVKKTHIDAKLPVYGSLCAACFDLHIASFLYRNRGDNTACYDTGLAFEIPQGYCMLIYSRSGHGFNQDIRLSNCVGVIDSDYRGSVKVKLRGDDISIAPLFEVGDRIAQAMIIPVNRVDFECADELDSTDRGVGGFGSTGDA